MNLFNFHKEREKHKIAQEVISNDRRTAAIYEAKLQNHNNERLIATLVVVILGGGLIMVLPKYEKMRESNPPKIQLIEASSPKQVAKTKPIWQPE